jgi:hypothetical protein
MRWPLRAVWPGVVLALLLSSGWAQDPFPPGLNPDDLAVLEELLTDVPTVVTLSVDGPQAAKPGQLLRLDAITDRDAAVLWHAVGVPADSWDTANGGATLFFSTAVPGRYVFLAVCACQGTGPVPEIRSIEHVVTISGPVPGPQPGPTPPVPGPAPAPDVPSLPAGRFGLAQLVYDGVKTLPPTEKPKAALVSQSYLVVSSQIAAGTIRDFNSALGEIRRRNEGKLDPNRAAHVQAWGNPLAQRLQDLSKAGKLGGPDDWRAALEETALGLRTWGEN